MALPARLKGRYEPKEVIAEGGMGIVYRALDLEMQSEVAIKTILQCRDPQLLDMFRTECAALRKLRHPNVVDLYDYGVVEEGGQIQPFFVMPLLPGVTLDKLIRNQTSRLTPERIVDIITQTARGLHAAHELGLVHRDIKPSNIFVLDDDSVKLIDFGVVHLSGQTSIAGLKGTLLYMSPEQIQMNSPTAVSDIFSLAVVCYEALTRRKPFAGNSDSEIKEAILHLTPPPISDFNPAVSLELSQVVHAAMAKQPWHRSSSARQFADELQKALHDQPIERFDPVRVEPRISRAQRALENSEYDFASAILGELEAEGHIHPAIRSLRRQIDQAVRAKTIRQSLESARHRFSEDECQLALQKVDEVLRLEAGNPEALALKTEIEAKYKDQQIENWLRLADDHIKNFAYNHAREALQNVLRLKTVDRNAIRMLAEVDRQESEYLRQRIEKEELYKVALEAWHRGEVSGALSKLERGLELDRRAPHKESGLRYQDLYNEVRSEHDAIRNAYEQAKKLLSENDFSGASAICDQFLNKYPEHALFQALQFDVGERQRQYLSAYIVKTDRDVEAEPDLDRKVAILSEALRLHPAEAHFKEGLDRITQRRDLVASIIQKVRNWEERGQYAEGLGQLEILRAIYPQYPGLDLETDRITKRRDQQAKTETRARWVDQIDRALTAGDFTHAADLLKSATADFPGDAELAAQERLARDGIERSLQALKIFEHAQRLCAQGELDTGLEELRQAQRLDEHSALIRAVLLEMLLKRASAEIDREQWSLSEQLIRQALQIDPASVQAKSLQRMAHGRQKDRAVDLVLSNSRDLQARGQLSSSLAAIEEGLKSYPQEPRLIARKEALLKLLGSVKPSSQRDNDLAEMRDLRDQIGQAGGPAVATLVERTRMIALKYPSDEQVGSLLGDVEDFMATKLFEAPGARGAKPSEPHLTGKLVHDSPAADPHQAERISKTSAEIAKPAKQGAKMRVVRPPPAPPAVLEREVSIQATVPGARLLVNGEDRGAIPQTLKFPQGEYRIDAKLTGYASKGPVLLRVGTGETNSASVTVPLEALPAIFHLSTDFTEASLDEEKLTLDGYRYETDRLAVGHHSLKLYSPVFGTINVGFDLATAQMPSVTNVQPGTASAIVVSTFADSGQIYSSSVPVRVAVNDQPVQEIAQQGGEIRGLQPGQNQLVFENRGAPRTETVNVNPNPGITVLLPILNAGNIRVTANIPDASIVVAPADQKGPLSSAQLRRGTAMITGLEPKAYRVQIQTAGYKPAEAVVTVQKGQVAAAKFTLEKLITTATVEIRGGTPDSEIYLDGSRSVLNANGDFTSGELEPGKHQFVFQKKDHEEKRLERELRAGETVRLGTEIRLTPFGRLEFNVRPAEAQVTYQIAGQAPVR
ncbi:MAG: hypothetical protein DMG15_10795, partial [Acidobacteria bacterium]